MVVQCVNVYRVSGKVVVASFDLATEVVGYPTTSVGYLMSKGVRVHPYPCDFRIHGLSSKLGPWKKIFRFIQGERFHLPSPGFSVGGTWYPMNGKPVILPPGFALAVNGSTASAVPSAAVDFYKAGYTRPASVHKFGEFVGWIPYELAESAGAKDGPIYIMMKTANCPHKGQLAVL